MELSINYSPQAAELITEGAIRVDRLKCADWPDMIAEASKLGPVYVHFPIESGPVSPKPVDLDMIDAMRRTTRTPFVNTHLVAYRDDGQSESEVEASLSEQLAALCDRFGADRVIAENIPYYADEAAPKKLRYHPACVDPAVIRRVVERAGCGFLLDISHARIAAAELGVDPKAYIEQLPVDRLRELHVTGIERVDGRLLDHMGLNEQDWAFTAWAVDHIGAGRWATPWCVAMEYGGVGEPFRWRSEKRVIAEQFPRLCDLVKGEL